MRLNHMGHAMNLQWGPLVAFATHNYADNYNYTLVALADGTAVTSCSEVSERIPEQEPLMPTLRQMHRICRLKKTNASTLSPSIRHVLASRTAGNVCPLFGVDAGIILLVSVFCFWFEAGSAWFLGAQAPPRTNLSRFRTKQKQSETPKQI